MIMKIYQPTTLAPLARLSVRPDLGNITIPEGRTLPTPGEGMAYLP